MRKDITLGDNLDSWCLPVAQIMHPFLHPFPKFLNVSDVSDVPLVQGLMSCCDSSTPVKCVSYWYWTLFPQLPTQKYVVDYVNAAGETNKNSLNWNLKADLRPLPYAVFSLFFFSISLRKYWAAEMYFNDSFSYSLLGRSECKSSQSLSCFWPAFWN